MKCFGHSVLLLMGVSFIANVNSLKVRGYFKCKEPQVEPTNAEDLATVTGEYRTGTDSIKDAWSESLLVENCSISLNAKCTRSTFPTNGNSKVQRVYNCSTHAVREERNDTLKCYCKSDYRGDGEICTKFSNCQDVFNAGYTTNGIYTIAPSNWSRSPFQVYCNMSEDGGWTVFQRRVNGSVDFYRNWTNYKEGFGELDHEFWLGNEKLYYLTKQGDYTLRIDLVNRYGEPYYAKYNLFRINDESDNYRLSALGTSSGTAGDALSNHRSHIFSTFDRDNDYQHGYNCVHHGAWWCKVDSCSNLNGNYHSANTPPPSILWCHLPKGGHHIKYTEMKIKPKV